MSTAFIYSSLNILLDYLCSKFSPSLSEDAAHVLLYHYTYNNSSERLAFDALVNLLVILHRGNGTISDFLRKHLNYFPQDHSHFLLERVTSHLRDPNIVDNEATNVHLFCSGLVLYGFDIFAHIELQEGRGIFSSYLIYFHRRICSDSSFNPKQHVLLMLVVFMYAVPPRLSKVLCAYL